MTRMETLKAIKREPITVEFSDAAIDEFNELVKRNEAVDGIPDAKYTNLNTCPICANVVGLGDNFCGLCGQRIKFTKSDIVPL